VKKACCEALSPRRGEQHLVGEIAVGAHEPGKEHLERQKKPPEDFREGCDLERACFPGEGHPQEGGMQNRYGKWRGTVDLETYRALLRR